MNRDNEKDLRYNRTKILLTTPVYTADGEKIYNKEDMLEAARIDTVLALVALQNNNNDSALVDLISAASCLAIALGRPLDIKRVKE
jgi:hypothetical protein